MNITALWDSLVDAICRPPRDVYQIGELLGGRRGYFKHGGKPILREDLTLVNQKGQKLHCSHYKPFDTTAEHGRPIVIYCHCNSGSRRDAEEAFYILLPRDVTVFCLDFAGSGLSDGDWVTLGAHEVEDLETAVAHLRKAYPESAIGLWGRSMGAVTALMYSQRDPSIAGVVMDSPFARLTELMVELVDEQKVPIPKAFMRVALGMMRRSVRKRAGFNIDDVAPLNRVSQCHIPALFGHATEDTFVSKTHSQRLHDAYAGEKDFITFKGDHNSVRPSQFYSSALIFLLRALRWEDHLQSPRPCLPLKSPVLAEMEAKAKLGKDGSGHGESMERADSGSKAECIVPTQTQRELAPPWDFNDAEHHLQLIKDFAFLNGPQSRDPDSLPRGNDGHNRALSDDTYNRIASPVPMYTNADLETRNRVGSPVPANKTPQQNGSPIEPPPPTERAPWLTPATEGKQIDEKVEVGNGKSMTEPQYYQPQHANGLENGSMPAAWAPARLARRLFEQSAAEGPVPSQRPKSGATPAAPRSTSMPEARDAVPSMRTQDPSDSEKRDIDQATLANNLWEMLHLRQNGNAGLPIGTGQASKQEDGPARMGYYQEHGPRRFGEQEKRQPTMEERFWQFTPDVPESEDSDDSAEERELAKAIEASIREQSMQSCFHSGSAVRHAMDEASIAKLIPRHAHNISQEEAEEKMLADAIKASLQEAAKNGLVDATPQPSQELPNLPSQSSDRTPDDEPSKHRSRALFWRRKEANGRQVGSPAKGVTGHKIR